MPAADRTPKDQADQLTMVARRDRSKRLAADTTAPADVRCMSKHDLRAELDQLGRMIDNGPPDQSRLVAHATTKREQDEQRLAEATGRRQEARDRLASLERGPARFLRRGDLAGAREQYEQAEEAYQVARQQADRAADRERQARQAQQQHEAHQEANPDQLARQRELMREKGWRKRVAVRAVELERPGWAGELGERPASIKGGRVWDRAVEQTLEYRQRHNVSDLDRPLAPNRTARTCRLSSDAPDGMPSRRSAARATWPPSTPIEATVRTRPALVVAEATADDQTTATTTKNAM